MGIDSDGCAFDTMELKQKECFIPCTIKHYGLQGVSKYTREAEEFVNLYSKSRGINRFPALVETLNWLRRRPQVVARGIQVPELPRVTEWIHREKKLGNDALKKEVKATQDPELAACLEWSEAVNHAVAEMVKGVPPFPFVRESLEKLQGLADVAVVSATPQEALVREWEEHGIASYVTMIGGQEFGTKKEMLQKSTEYPKGHSLMLGDAPGDYKAAMANQVLFFPINPGDEEKSWQRFFNEGIDRFLHGTFDSAYQQELVDAFEKYLPVNPPWPVL
ncbi:MAG: HAD hydrolase-like protein [Thermoguttaceae bacterium]|nr:HAD hydrolase-like protein [Thermoguttaceae bacterium]